MEWIFRNQETVAARSKYTHQLSSSNNAHPIEYFVYCSMGTVKFELLSWFSIVRDVWRQHFSVLSQKTNNTSVVSSHFHLYLRISALRLPTVQGHSLHFELLIEVLAKKLRELWQFQNLSYFLTWWPSFVTNLIVQVTCRNEWPSTYMDPIWWWFVKAFVNYAWKCANFV